MAAGAAIVDQRRVSERAKTRFHVVTDDTGLLRMSSQHRMRVHALANLPTRRTSSRRRIRRNVTTREDIASVAEQLAELTRTVDAMAKDLKAMTERADRQQARADSQQDLVDSQQERAQMQQERIDLAARELADVSDRLQAAATALRESI